MRGTCLVRVCVQAFEAAGQAHTPPQEPGVRWRAGRGPLPAAPAPKTRLGSMTESLSVK